MNTHIYVNGALTTEVKLRSIRASYVRPWEAVLHWPARHDAPAPLDLNDVVIVREPGTGRRLFRGNVAERTPGGVAGEGVTFRALGKRWRLENEPVRINGRGFYMWNRRGYQCDDGEGGEDSPDGDGLKWTAGQIIVDILEHAAGVPFAGSGISGHHASSAAVEEEFLSADDLAGWDAADILTRDSVVGEFSVNDTPVADAISLLLGMNGDLHGWYVDPESGELVVVDLDALPETDVEAGELGHWQDEAGTDYRLLDNELTWSLDGVYSTLVIQGADRTTEEQPADIEGSANAGQGHYGELEFVAAPWRDYAAAYRPVYQSRRSMTPLLIDAGEVYTPPAGYGSFSFHPRVYQGKPAGPKTLYVPAGGVFPTWHIETGIIGFHEDPRPLGYGQQLWGWYFARTPFTVTEGPDGDAYHWYGHERTRTVYDPAFKHTSSWPTAGTADDEAAMTTLAERLLRAFRDVRRQGTLVCDEVDFDAYDLLHRYNVRNLGQAALLEAAGTTGYATTTTLKGGYRDPGRWDTLALNSMDVLYDFEHDATEITVANTFWMLEDYSELKRRLELNLFARRELALSADVLSCQTHSGSLRDTGEENQDDDGNWQSDHVGTTEELIDGEEKASTSWWARDDTAVRVTMVTRVTYVENGDQTLYAYYRDLVFDVDGRLRAVSDETEVVIDEPAHCA